MPHIELGSNQASARRSAIAACTNVFERRGVVAFFTLSVSFLLVGTAIYMGKGRGDNNRVVDLLGEPIGNDATKQAAADRLRFWWNKVNQMQTDIKDMRTDVDQVWFPGARPCTASPHTHALAC
jgi:hypothetical protein